MNIAVIVETELFSGGAFQFALSTVLSLNKYKNDKYNFIYFTTEKKSISEFSKYKIRILYLRLSIIDKIFTEINKVDLVYKIIKKMKICRICKLDRILMKHDIDLIYFVTPSDLSLATERFNYIFTVLDLCHRDFMEFPEVNFNRVFEERENTYRNALPKAIKIIALSDSAKMDIIKRYNIDTERVVAVSLLPSNMVNIAEEEYERNYIDIKRKYNINGEYIFYPAQFWSHKNHIYILEGLKVLKEKHKLVVNAVFSGRDKGNLDYIIGKVKELGLESQIFYIGFAASEGMPYLYKQALALVMPTYCRPVNIPPLEAFKLGCPVLYSDLPGLRDQVQGAALLLDLKNPENLADNILKLINKEVDVNALIEEGQKKIKNWTEDDYWLKLKEVFDEYSIKLKCWK